MPLWMRFKGELAPSQTAEQLNQGYVTREVSYVSNEARQLLRCNLKFHSESAREGEKKIEKSSEYEEDQKKYIKKKKIKEQKITPDLASLASASEKLGDNYHTMYN